MNLLRSGIMLALAVIGSFGQSSCGQPPPPAASQDFRITLTRSGGFTGMASGYHLRSDGTLTAWRRALAQDEQVAWSTRCGADQAADWAGQLHGATQGWSSQETGNMTSVLEFSRGDTTTTWTWAGTGVPATAPQATVEWLQAFDRFTRDAQPK